MWMVRAVFQLFNIPAGYIEKAWISVIPIAFCEISGKQENPAVLLKVKHQLHAEHQGLRGDTDLTAYLSCGAARLVLLLGLAAAGGGRRVSNRALGGWRAGVHWPLTSFLPLFVKQASFPSSPELSVLCMSPVSP